MSIPYLRCARKGLILAVGAVLVASCGGGGPPARYTIGVTVSGLAGSGLILQDNGSDNLAVAAAGSYTFATSLESGSAYAVTVQTQPTSPVQTCTLANAAGVVNGANVANVAVTCKTNAYDVGGTISGLTGSGLVLEDNGGDNLAVAANGSFTFSTAVTSGAAYAATISTQPTRPAQTCVIANATGTVTATAIANITITCTTNPGRFVYVSSHAGIYCYKLNGVTGALTALATSPCDTGVLSGVAVDPSGKFAYATLATANQIQAYSIDQSTGSLSVIAGSQLNGGGMNPLDIVVDPLDRFVYMANYAGGISAFSLNPATGSLAAVSGSPFPTAPGGGVTSVTVDPSGKFLYAAISLGYSISAYLIDSSTGALTPIAGSPFSAGVAPMTVRVDPSGKYAYATNAFTNNISAYSIDSSTGALTSLAGSPFLSGGAFPVGLAIDPAGAYVFVANSNSNNISVFALDNSTGGLTPVAGSPFSGGLSPWDVSVDPSGKFLYESDNGAGSISAFTVDSANGSLTPIAGSPFPASGNSGTGTYSIAISD